MPGVVVSSDPAWKDEDAGTLYAGRRILGGNRIKVQLATGEGQVLDLTVPGSREIPRPALVKHDIAPLADP